MFKDKIELLIQKDRQTLEWIYAENFSKVEKLVLRNSGNKSQAQDIFQDALIEVWRRLKDGKFSPKSIGQLEAYLFRISKYMWYDELKLKSKIELREANGDPAYIEVDWDALYEREHRLKVIFESLKEFEEPCKSILKEFYYKKSTYEQMSERLSYDSATLKSMKYRCLNKFKAMVKNKIQEDGKR